MAYDMIGPPHQLANCPYDGLAKSVKDYASYGVAAHKIVFGLPWYGYRFPCANSTRSAACEPNCADGRKTCPQIDYAAAVQELNNFSRTTGIDEWKLDTASQSVYFESLSMDGASRHQLWFDDEVSLAAKYRACRAFGARGVAMWTAGSLEYGNEGSAGYNRTATMWGALREFTLAT
jgi:di-N-acetylchitobiase